MRRGLLKGFRPTLAFTFLEMIAVMVIITILAALIIPATAAVRSRGRQTVCLSNMRQIGLGLTMYRDEHKDTYPLTNDWQTAVSSYMRGVSTVARTGGGFVFPDAYLCPEIARKYNGANPGAWGYAYNLTVVNDIMPGGPRVDVAADGSSKSFEMVPEPAKKSYIACGYGGGYVRFTTGIWNLTQTPVPNPWKWQILPEGIHRGVENYLFCDGHIEAIPVTDLSRMNNAWFNNVPSNPGMRM